MKRETDEEENSAQSSVNLQQIVSLKERKEKHCLLGETFGLSMKRLGAE